MMSSQWLTLIGGVVCYGLSVALSVWLQTQKHTWVSYTTEICVNTQWLLLLTTTVSLWHGIRTGGVRDCGVGGGLAGAPR